MNLWRFRLHRIVKLGHKNTFVRARVISIHFRFFGQNFVCIRAKYLYRCINESRKWHCTRFIVIALNPWRYNLNYFYRCVFKQVSLGQRIGFVAEYTAVAANGTNPSIEVVLMTKASSLDFK